MNWYFTSFPGVIELRARAEACDEQGNIIAVGDAFREIGPGQRFYGLSYLKLRRARAGIVEIDENNRGRILQR